MATKYLPQFKPQSTTRELQLQPRDLAILKTVFEYRFLDGELLRALFASTLDDPRPAPTGSPTAQAITRRLAKLYHHGYLDRPRAQLALRIRYGNRPMVYALANKGAKALAAQCGIDMGRLWNWQLKNREATDPYILHQLMTSTFRATLELATNAHPLVKLAHWKQGDELRYSKVNIGGLLHRKQTELAPVHPDGLLGLRFTDRPEGSNTMNFFLEADRGTMTHKRFLRKLLAYLRYYESKTHLQDYQIKEFRVLTITPTPARRDNLRAFLQEQFSKLHLLQSGGGRFWFASETTYDPNNPATVLQTIWHTLKDEQPCSILPKPYA